MSLMGNLYVGNSGLQTAQMALNTTAHNMANMDTEGFTRQQVSLGTRSYLTLDRKLEPIAWTQVGNGVYYNNCKQVRSVFLDAAYRQESGRYSFYDTSLKALEEITDTISKISDYSHRALLINYYVNGMTWEMTAEVMGFEVRTIYRMHDDALEEIEKILCQ